MTRLRNPYADTPMGELRERLASMEVEREIERKAIRDLLGRPI